MDIKEITRRIFNIFFTIFFCSMVVAIIYLRFIGENFIYLSDVLAILVLSALSALTEIIFYSKRELRRSELFVRHLLNLFLIIVVVLSTTIFMRLRWISWDDPIHVIIFIGVILGIYIMTTAIDFYQTAKTTNRLTQKLKERYK